MDRLGQPRVLRPAAVGHLLALGRAGRGRRGGRARVGADGVRRGRRAVPPPAPGRHAVAVGDAGARRAAARDRVRDGHDRLRGDGHDRAGADGADHRAGLAVGRGAGRSGDRHRVRRSPTAATDGPRRWRGERHDVGWVGPLAAAGMRTLAVVLLAFGTAIGIVQVLLPAFADERGSAETGGLLLALLSGGSLIGGLVYGARSWPGPPRRRLATLMLGAGGRLGAARRCRTRWRCSPCCSSAAGACSPPPPPPSLDAARPRRPARHRHRGVHGDGDVDRGRDRGRQRARRRDRRRGLLRGRAP